MQTAGSAKILDGASVGVEFHLYRLGGRSPITGDRMGNQGAGTIHHFLGNTDLNIYFPGKCRCLSMADRTDTDRFCSLCYAELWRITLIFLSQVNIFRIEQTQDFSR